MSQSVLTENNLPDYISCWKTRYENKKTSWLVNTVHPFLTQNINTLLESKSSTNDVKKIFVPLCGTTYDLAYLLSRGFEVFGVEGVKSCFGIINERDGLNLRFNEKDSTFETYDGKLKIFHGDLYSCPIEKWGPFDLIWDRASLIAIEPEFREIYAKQMKSAVEVPGNDFNYFLEVVEYDKSKFKGPPHALQEDDISKLYPDYNLEIIFRDQIKASSHLFNIIPTGLDAVETIYKLFPRHNML